MEIQHIPRIKTLAEKKFIGMCMTMSLAANKTTELWKNFMPVKKEITNTSGTEYYAVQFYPASYFEKLQPETEFVKWAALEVKHFDAVPANMNTFVIPGGLYAVFFYKGLSSDSRIFQYIFSTWLPGSEYELDNRPHFEVLGEKYKNNDPESEEEIWIPVKEKTAVSQKHLVSEIEE